MARLIELQNNWRRGMKQDIPRTSMPDGSAWNLVDWIPDFDAALTGRGGWAYGSQALGSGTTQGSASNKLIDTSSTTGTSRVTDASLSVVANNLYLATVVTKTSAVTPVTPTLTGAGLTWVQMATLQEPTGRPFRISMFRGLRTSGSSSGKLTVTTGAQSTTQWILGVDEFVNVNTTGTNGSGAVGTPVTGGAASGTTATVTLAAFSDAVNDIAYAATMNESATAIDPESGWTELVEKTIASQATLETEWKLGQDTTPTATWTTTQNWAMVAVEVKCVPATVTANYVAAGAYAPFRAAPKLCAISDTGVLATIDTTTLAATSVGATTTPLQVAFHQDKLIITAANGTSKPYYFDGTTLTLLPGAPPAGKYAVVYRDRTVIAGANDQPTRLYFSDPADPTTWDVTQSWLSVGAPITGLAALPGALMIFQAARATRVRGSTPPPDSDMVEDDPVFNVGCTDARSIATTSSLAAFANPGGIYLTNGTNLPTDLTKAVGLKHYWQTLMVGYDASTWTLAGGFYQNNYVISVMNGAAFVDCLMFNLDNYSAVRLSNFTATCFFSGQQIAEELWFGLRDEAKLGRFSTVFTPGASFKADADGTAVTTTLETAMYGVEPAGVKSWRYAYLQYDLRDAGSDNPTWAVSYIKNPADSYMPLATMAESTDRTRKRLPLRFPSDGIAFKIVQSNPAAAVRFYGFQADVHGREQSRI